MKVLCLSSLLVAGVCGMSAARAEPVTFEWFEYAGRDATFSAPLPAGQVPQSRSSPATTRIPSVTRVGDKYLPGQFHLRALARHPDPREHRPRALEAHRARAQRSVQGQLRRPRAFRAACSRRRSISTTALSTSSTRWWTPAAISSSPRRIRRSLVGSGVAQGNRRHRSVVLLRRRRQGLHPEQRTARRHAALQRPSRHLDAGVRPRGQQAHRTPQGAS